MLDLADIGYIKRITAGSRDPQAMLHHEDIEAAVAVLNRALTEVPRGRIIAVERSFQMLGVQDNVVVLQWVCYHVGFPRKPPWLDA